MVKRGAKPKPFDCPEQYFWYLVGLIATDGCLSGDRRHIDVTLKEEDHLARIRNTIGLRCGVTKKLNGAGQTAYHMQIGSRILYDRLLMIGLTSKKSLTLGALQVPSHRFTDFLRGVIDGDGNIRRWKHPTNGREQWSLRIFSASKPFMHWISETSSRLWNVEGKIHEELPENKKRHTKYILKYGKLAAKVILGKCYYKRAFALERKRAIADRCVCSDVGWSQSKTVVDRSSWKGWTYKHTYGETVNHSIIRENFQRKAGVVERFTRVT